MAIDTKMKYRLLASSPTVEGIETAIRKYFGGSTGYEVNVETLELTHPTKCTDDYRIISRKGRYRWELMDHE